jgi:hypothetical protein
MVLPVGGYRWARLLIADGSIDSVGTRAGFRILAPNIDAVVPATR